MRAFNTRPPRHVPPPRKAPSRKAAVVAPALGLAEAEAEEETAAPAPGLGGVRRFASGRRAPEWVAAMEEDDGHVARSGPL